MEDKPLSIDSTKEEVSEYFVKNFKFPESATEILIKEDISGSVLPQLSQLKQKEFLEIFSAKEKVSGVSYQRIKNYLRNNEDKFKEKEIKEVILAHSDSNEVKNFFDKYLNFQKELNGLNGKSLIELDEPKMIQLGLNLGQRLKLKKYIEHFKSLNDNLNKKDNIKITKNSTEQDVAEFLKIKLKFSQDSIDLLGFDAETFLDLKIEDIDSYDTLKEEERKNLKKYLSGELNFEEEKYKSEPDIIITNESNEKEVSTFLEKKFGFKKEVIEEFKGYEGRDLLSLTDEVIEGFEFLTLEEKNKIKEFIKDYNSKKNKIEKVDEINEKSNEEEIINFLKKKLNINKIEVNLLTEKDIEKIQNLTEKEKLVLNDFIKNKNIFNTNSNNITNINISDEIELSKESTNKIRTSSDFVDFYFVIGINYKDYKDHEILVQTQGVDKKCDELVKIPFEIDEEKYYQILYNIKLKITSKFCLIKMLSKIHNKSFKSINQGIYFNDEDIYFLFQNLIFDYLTVSNYAIFYAKIEPPSLYIQDFYTIFSTYYNYIYKNSQKNTKLVNELFLKGLMQLKNSNMKFTLNFFLQIISLSLYDKNNSNIYFLEIISLFNINSLKDDKFPIENSLNNLEQNFELILKFCTNKDIRNDEKISIKFDILISFCYLMLCDISSAIKFINDSPHKVDIVSNIIGKLYFFQKNIFQKELLKLFLSYCNKNDESNIKTIINQSLNIVDYIDLIFENIEIFKNIPFKFKSSFQLDDDNPSEETIQKLFAIIKECKNLTLYDQIILNKFPNFFDVLSIEQKIDLYKILKDDNKTIKQLIYKKMYSEANSNTEIIYFIDGFKTWEDKEKNNDIYNKFKKFDFLNVTPSDFEKLEKIFKNYKFSSLKNKNFGVLLFYLILNQMNNIYNFPNILWKLFEPNISYRFEERFLNFVLNKYLELFSNNILSNSRDNLFKLINQTLDWFINNSRNPELFLENLEKIMNKKEEDKILNEPYIIKLYTEFLFVYYKKEKNSLNNYLIDYLKTRIMKMEKQTLEKLLNIKGCTEKIIPLFNQYKLSRNDFFQEKSENLKLFKLLKEIPNNNYLINSQYYINSQEVLQKVVIDLQSMNCTYQELLQISELPNKEIDNRIEIFQIDNESKKNLKNIIKDKINEYEVITKRLNLCKTYSEKIEITDSEDKIFFQKIKYLNSNFDNKGIHNITIQKIEKYLNKDGFLTNFNNIIERAQKLNNIEKFKCGKMFINQVKIKMEKEENKFQEIISNINQIKNFFEKEMIFQIKEEQLEKFFNLFINEDEIIEEINKLKELFSIENDDEKIVEYLKYNFLKEKTKKIVLSYINTIEILHLKYNIFINIKNIIERISELNINEKDFEGENIKNKNNKLTEIISEFESMGKAFNLKIFPLDPISLMLKNLWDNKLFEFLFHITNNDLRDLNSYLTGTSFDINDINNYLIIKQLLIFFKKEANYFSEDGEDEDEINKTNKIVLYEKRSDEKFFELIKNDMDNFIKEMKIININEIIKNASDKKNQIEELLKNRNGYEKHLEEINMIMSESVFEIFYMENLVEENSKEFESGYNCQVTFSNKEKKKYFKDIIEMQQIASLSQNKSQNNNTLIIFIDTIDKIKDLLNYCNILTSKGYPDYFKFKLSIKNMKENYFKNLTGNIVKEKTLDEQSKELKKILKKMENLQMDAYKNSRYLKFFSGQQLLKLNNFIKNKITDNKEKKNQIKHLLIYLIRDKNINFNADYKYINYISDNNEDQNKSDEEEEEIINTSNKKKEDLIIFKLKKDDLNIDEREMINTMNIMFLNIENYLTKIINESGLDEEKIFKDSLITNKDYKDEKGFFILENKNIYEQALKFYNSLVGKNPPRYSILVCNDETTLEELLAFLYLSCMCKYHSLFIILKPDKLKISIKIDFQDKVEYFRESQINSLIIILFDNIGKSDIGKELLNMKIERLQEPKENLNVINEIEVISSSLAGYGKSTYIIEELKNEFKHEFGDKEIKTNFKYICFPLGGTVKRSIIMKRLLKDLKIENKKYYYGIHLDLSETDQIELFQDFLFCFLIQKQYTQSENIFCYEGNIRIKIEIPKGFYDFSEKMNILKLFKQTKISSLPKFKILNELDKHFDDEEDIKKDKELYLEYITENNLDKASHFLLESDKIPEDIKELRKTHRYFYQSEVQLVCNYLKLFDSNIYILTNKNLFFYSFSEMNYELEENDWYYIPEFINEEECQELIKKYLNKENCTYHQINIFIKVLYHQLKLFSINYFLMPETFEMGQIDKIIRFNLVKAFLDLTKFFTIGAFDELLNEQKGTKFNYDENTIKAIANELSSKEKTINFDNLKDNSLICINEDKQSLTILTNCDKNSEDYENLEDLLNMGRKSEEERLHLIDLNSEKNDFFYFSNEIKEEEKEIPNCKYLVLLKRYLCINKTITEMRKEIGSYTFTKDNFFKMILILLRIKSGISIILMGETGCGKTSLVNTICSLCDYKKLLLPINSGTTDNDIVAFFGKNNLAEEILNYEENGNDNEPINEINVLGFSGVQNEHDIYKKSSEDKENKLIVVFLDELNTCNSQGLLTEIMCKHTIQGKNIKKNVAFIGACNPYRKKENGKELENTGLIKKESKYSNLVYTVNPLTHSQLYYVLNFGTLNTDDERKYVESIAEYELVKIIKDQKLLEIIYPFLVDSFIFSQQYIREKKGKESVSLREIKKFFAIYKFILWDFKRKQKLILNKDNYNNINEEEMKLDYNFYKTNKTEKMIHKYSITVGIFICFYVRLNLEEREEFEMKANSIFELAFTEYSKKLQDEIINNIIFEKGIAKNNILKLNLFITFIGILTKIAVFLVGPPGCSKTLCLNLLKKSMKGINSKSKYWKLYPQLYVTSYQGSLTSTSKGIKEAFNRAEYTLKKWKEKKSNQKDKKEMDGNDIISLVFIDEIGLCEISPFNPLKVLHSYLELDIDDKISFVGISNWKLDASKMNRGIFLNVFSPESNVEEMKNTAYEISRIYSKTFISEDKNKNLLNSLVESVYKYKNGLNINKDKNRNFHGTRDFYYLIKTLVSNIIKKQNTSFNIYDEIFFAIESNYNGLYINKESSASRAIESELIKRNPFETKNNLNKYSTIDLIKRNIKDNESRYLLLITESNLSQYLVKQMIKSEQEEREIVYYLGSLFEDDIYSETYSAKAITQIKYYLEEPIILVLKNLSTTYASLYDLFNQRFNYTLGKKYAEISMRDVTNPSLVNDSLKIIILIDQKFLEYQDPPFLNRFQKHIISFYDLLNKEELEMADKFYDIRNIFQKIDGLKCNPENQLINFYKEEINGLVFYSKFENNSQKKTYEDYEDFILSKLAKTFSQDLIMFLNVYQSGYKNLVEKINKFYKKSIHSNLENYLMNAEQSKNIIYTFTSILKNNFKFEIINNKYGKINSKEIIHIIAKNIKSERALEKFLDDFYCNNPKICMIHFENDDLENLEFISNYIERIEKDKYIENAKLFLLTIHLKRSLTETFKESFLSNLSSYSQSFVDNLSGRNEEIFDILGKTQKELFYSSLINVEDEFLKNIFSIFTTIEYILEDKDDKEKNSNQLIQKNINILLSNNELKKNIIEKVVDKIAEEEKIFDSIFRNHNFDDKEFVSMIINELKEKFTFYLFKFIVNSEKIGFIYFHSKEHSELSKEIWQNYLAKQDYFSGDISFQVQGNKINVISSNLPSHKSIKEIRKIIELRKDEYKNEEKKIRYFNYASDLLYDLSDDKKIDENSDEFFKKQKLIDEFFQNANQDINSYKYANIKDLIKLYFIFPKEDLINNLINTLQKNEIYLLIPKNQLKEGLYSLFEDFYRQYSYEIIGSHIEECVNLIKLLINLRFPVDKDNSESYYIKSVLWLEIYKEDMVYILNIAKEILPIEPEITSRIKEKYEKKDVEYVISLHHPLFKKEINYPFLIFLDSISLILLNFILSNDIEKLNTKLDTIANINKKAEIINLNLRLLSKDFYRFKITYLIMELLNKKNKLNDKQLLDQYINSLFKERKFIKENDIQNAFAEFNSQYELLFNNFRGIEGFEQLMISLIVSKYKEVNDEVFREKLLSKIKNDNTLIKFSTELFVIIFRRYRIEPYYLEENNNEPDNPFSPESKNDIILKVIDGGKKGMPNNLKEILKTIFKFNINQYFKDEIGNKKDIRDIIKVLLGKDAFNDFKNSYENLKNIMLKKYDDIYNYNIKEQYCIAYCNVFLENFVKYTFEEKEYSSEIRDKLLEFLNDQETETPLKASIKIVILKMIKTYYIKDQFTFIFKKDEWSNKYYFDSLIKDYNFISTDNLLHLFYNGKNEEQFKNILDEKNIIDKDGGSFKELNEHNFFNIFDCLINQNLSNIKSNKIITYSHHYSFNPIIEFANKRSINTKELINLFFNMNIFEKKMKPLIENLNTDDFELLLYGYKLVLSCSLANKDSIYAKMIGKNWENEIYNAYIPGAGLFSDLFVESHYYINKYIENSNKDGCGEGFYICNCGEWYHNPFCGVPVNTTNCLNCKKEVGGIDEILTKRGKDKYDKEIIRIYYDENNKRNVETREDLIERYGNEWYDSMLLKDFNKEMETKMNQDYKGINYNNYLIFVNQNKKVRELSQVSYRILNYIIYSNILFNYLLDYLTLDDLQRKNIVPIKEEIFNGELTNQDNKYDDFSSGFWETFRLKILENREKERNINDILHIININWQLLKKALEKENISNIYCFMNIIFDEMNKTIKNSKGMKTPEERVDFEREFNEIICKYILNFNELSENYIKLSKIYEGTSKDPILGFPQNIEEEYPYLYQLFSIRSVSKKSIMEIMDSIENSEDLYPALYYYLHTNEDAINYLQNINLMNEFVLFTIENYSYQIDREKAKNLKMSSEIRNGKIPIGPFNNFKLAFNEHELYLKELQYNCIPLTSIDKKKLDEVKDPSLPLYSFLIDNGDIAYGMQIAAIYQDFAAIQNTFLNKIKPKINKNDRLKYLVKKMDEKIPPQKAKKCNIISFKIISENYNTFLQMLLLYSYKDEYGNIKYDLNAIENDLESILLPEKKIFDENIYVIYQYESFRNNNSSIIPNFCYNYPQVELNEKEKQDLYNFRDKMESNDSNKKILFSIQILIFYLSDSKEFDRNKKIKEIINDNFLPNFVHLSNEIIKLFNEYNFTLSKLFSVYEYFELLCYDDFKNNTDQDYMEGIPEEKLQKLKEYFEKKEGVKKGYLITKKILSSAVRKFISRFLSGTRSQQEINRDFELFTYMKYREDIWKIEVRENDNFEKELSELIQIGILAKNAIKLYDFLGGDEFLLGEEVKKEIQNKEEKIKEEKEKKIEEERNNNNRNRRRRNNEIIF